MQELWTIGEVAERAGVRTSALRFYVDGAEIASWSGSVPWTLYTYPATAGTHTFQWSYTKDGSVDTGDDAAYVDFIEFPPLGELPCYS